MSSGEKMVMISFWADRDQTNCFTRKSPLSFFANLFKKKKYKAGKCSAGTGDGRRLNNSRSQIPQVPKTLSVSVMDMRMTSPCPLSPALSTLTLTPGRTRDIDQDMEALRLSRQDNPFLQVLASRESLAESLFESESDDMNLMSQEFPNELDIDPLSRPEIHEHMIRSPPPTNWPKSPYFKVFTFPNLNQNESTQGSDYQCGIDTKFERITSNPQMKDQLDANNTNKYSKCNEFVHSTSMGCYSTIHSTHSPRSSIINKPHQRSSSECRDRTCNPFPVLRPKPMWSLSDIRRLQVNGSVRETSPSSEEPERKFDAESPITVPLLSKKFS